MRSGLTPVVAVMILVFLTLIVASSVTMVVTTVVDEELTMEQSEIDVREVSEDCDRWLVDVLVRNTGGQNVTKEGIDVYVDGEPRFFLMDEESIPPRGHGRIEVPYFGQADRDRMTISHQFDRTHQLSWRCGTADFSNQMAFVAWTGSDTHWVSYDYVDRDYAFYSSDDEDLDADDGPETGDLVVVEDQDEYTIQDEHEDWEDRAVDTPVVLVENPDPSEEWEFTWHDPHGSFTFHVPPVHDATVDYLMFWEDLYNPYDPPAQIDDWKDHVVRVSYIPPQIYRVAPYLGKGGHKHSFYLSVDQDDPLEGKNVYNKSHGEWMDNEEDGVYYEDTSYFVLG